MAKQGEDRTSVTVDPRLHTIYNALMDRTSYKYKYPVQEAILGYGQMDAPHRTALLAEAAVVGQKDAASGVLMHNVTVAPNLEALLARVPDAMSDVVGQRQQIQMDVLSWNEELAVAADESESLIPRERLDSSIPAATEETESTESPATSGGGTGTAIGDNDATLLKAEYHVDMDRADLHAFGEGRSGKGMLVLGVIVAVIGVAVDAVLLGAAIEATEMFDSVSSQALGLVASIFLGFVAFLSGLFYGRSRQGGSLSQDQLDESLWSYHNNRQAADSRRRQPMRWLFVATAAVIIIILFLLWLLRFMEWRDLSETVGSGGDARGQSIFVQAAIIFLALLSLIIFAYEGFQVAMGRRRKAAEQSLADDESTVRMIKERSTFARVFKKQASENAEDLKSLECDIAEAVQSLRPLFDRIIEEYRGAAISWLSAKDGSPLQAQIPVFEGIGDSVKTFEERVANNPTVLRFLSIRPEDCRPTSGDVSDTRFEVVR